MMGTNLTFADHLKHPYYFATSIPTTEGTGAVVVWIRRIRIRRTDMLSGIPTLADMYGLPLETHAEKL